MVVFAAPQLSLDEMRRARPSLNGRKVESKVALIACTAPAVKEAADRLGITGRIEAAGGIVLEGVCFYNMHAREIGDAKLAAADEQLGENRQHSWRLWLRAGLGVYGALRQIRLQWRIMR